MFNTLSSSYRICFGFQVTWFTFIYFEVIGLYARWILCDCRTNSCNILVVMWFHNVTWRYEFIVPSDDDCIYHNCFAMLLHFMMKIFVTNALPYQLPPQNLWWKDSSQKFCHIICHVAYHIICHVACHIIISMTNIFIINVSPCQLLFNHVERHECMNCDILRHNYDELEWHIFSDDCDAHHKIYDDFLLIIVVLHLTRTFCDDDLFVTMALPKYKLWRKNHS
jgi:hypothetical protein